MTELGVALAFAEAGMAIIPVRVFRDGDRLRKRPHIKAWRERASTDVEVVAGWWREWPEAVPGIVLEHCGLVVVDCDRHAGGADGVAAFAALGPFPDIRWCGHRAVASITTSDSPSHRLALALSRMASTCLGRAGSSSLLDQLGTT